jgi:hypothetical protein
MHSARTIIKTSSPSNRKRIKNRNSRSKKSRIRKIRKRSRVCRIKSKDKLIISGKSLIRTIQTNHLLPNSCNCSKSSSF